MAAPGTHEELWPGHIKREVPMCHPSGGAKETFGCSGLAVQDGAGESPSDVSG